MNFYYSNGPSADPYAGAAAANSANQARYQQILNGYQQSLADQQKMTGNITAGYAGLVASQQGLGQSQQLALKQQSAQQQGQAQQSLVSRGMGNTTVLDDTNRGINYDLANAQNSLFDQQTQAVNALKGQQLGYQSQAQQQYAGIQGQALNFMQGVNAQPMQNQIVPYQTPNQLASQAYGLQAQQLQNTGTAQQLYGQQGYGTQQYGTQQYGGNPVTTDPGWNQYNLTSGASTPQSMYGAYDRLAAGAGGDDYGY